MADIVKKFGDVKRTRYNFETKDGKVVRHEKEIVLKNCYILTIKHLYLILFMLVFLKLLILKYCR